MDAAHRIWDEMLEGNRRFRTGRSEAHLYAMDEIDRLAAAPSRPDSVVLACCDSRIAPEVIFDHPLGTIFSSRIPGNCATESAKWAIELAVCDLQVPLIVVLAHTGCLAVGQILDGKIGGPGGSLRMTISHAVHRARVKNPPDILREAVIENAKLSARELYDTLHTVRRKIDAGEAAIVIALYDMPIGTVETIEWLSTKD